MKNRITIPMPVRYAINIVLIVALWAPMASAIAAGDVSRYWSGIIITTGINIILAVSLNISVGYLGQLPLGHAGFMAVGAYTGGIFLRAGEAGKLVKADETLALLPYVIGAIVLAALVAGLFGLIIGIPALRLKGDYLAIITLGFGEIIRVVITNIDSVLGFELTNGSAGLLRIPKITNFSIVFTCVVLSCTLIHMIMKSRHGRAILSIRENEIAAESCGINTTYYKVLAFVVSAGLAGVAGCLYAGYLGSLYPATFGFMKSIEILVMVVLGGMGSMLGSMVSASALTFLPELLRTFADYRMVAYSLLLVTMMIFRPKGLFGTYDFSMSRILEKILNMGRTDKKKEGKQ